MAVAVQFVAFLAILPLHTIVLGEVVAFIPTVDVAMCLCDLIIATKLYSQAAIFRSRALTVLASGYVFGALLLIPQALTFPGAFAPNGLLGGGASTAVWLVMMNRLAFPAIIIVYVVVKSVEPAAHRDPQNPPPRTLAALACAIVLSALAALLTTRGHDWLPPLFVDKYHPVAFNFAAVSGVGILLTLAAMALLFRQKNRSLLDMWLLVALFSWLFQSVLTIPVAPRFTVGWYGRYGLQLLSSFIVMVALIAETNRLYARLAVWAQARERERETRMMSLDAVAAAFSHEVGQPLTAMTLSATAGLHALASEQPDTKTAIQAFRDTLEGGRLTLNVLKSIRATFAGGWESASEFDLNDLVRETASLMARELAALKIDLQLMLDEALPPIFANQVQIQRVLVNLLTNAIESIRAAKGSERRIAIRSGAPDSESVLLEISDTGGGIAPENMADIFDPFFTTKATGTGLGLSLATTIAAEHGGHLWASHREGGGATFHLQLPRDARPKVRSDGRLAASKGAYETVTNGD